MTSQVTRKRVLHVLGAMNPGGVETWLMHVLRNVDRQRYPMDFLVHTTKPGAFDDEIVELGSRIIPCPFTRRPISYARRFSEVVRQHGPFDVVHSHVFHYSGFVARIAWAVGVPTRVAHAHTTGRPVSVWNVKRNLYERLMRRWIWRYGTHGLGMSKAAAESLFGSRWASDSRFEVIRPGFDFGRFKDVAPRDDAKAAIEIPRERLVLGHVGRFVRVKNHHRLIEVLDRLRAQGIDAHLLLVGDGPLKGEVRQEIERRHLLERVSFAGSQADVAPYYAAMDIFIFPSRYEGFGIVALEAQAAGVPILASAVLPSEVDIVPGLIRRLDLASGADTWADSVVRMVEETTVPPDAFEQVARSRFGIGRCLEDLTRVYSG